MAEFVKVATLGELEKGACIRVDVAGKESRDAIQKRPLQSGLETMGYPAYGF